MESKYVNYLTAIDNAKEYSQVYDRIIVVGSVGMETDFSKALFDNTITINRGDSGYHISTFSNLGERVDVVAPGEDIFSTVYDEKDKHGNKLKYNYAQGTSMATPHVSGIAAIVWSANNNLTGAEVKDIICSSANNLVNLGEYGSEYNKTDYKLVNAKSALEKALGIETIETTEESKNGGILNYVVEKDNEDVKIKNAQVVAVGTDGTEYKTTTDEQGHFELILPEGVYTLTITKDEYKPYTWENVKVKNEGVNYLSDWTKLEKIQNYTWHLDPTIEADNIIVPDYDNELFEKYAIIEKNGKYGLISNTGELIEDVKYKNFIICPLNIYVIGNGDVSDFELNNKENIGYKIENEKLIKTNHIGHGIGDITYYYYNINDNKVYAVPQIGNNYKEYKDSNVVLAQSVSISIKEDGTYSCNNIYDDFYLVNNNGKINSNTYENGNNYYFNSPNNIIYAKQNNEWYYFNNKGEQIIFDNIESNYMENGHIQTNKINKNNIIYYPFSDVENVIAINTGDNGIFYDIKGNRLTNSKEFEEVRPMINGFAWVKKDGKWGVIKFNAFNSIENYENLKQKYNKQTESKEEEKEAWKMEYIEYIKGIAQKDSYIYDNGKFLFVNINGDDIPEIFYDSGSGYGGSGIITYSNKKVVELHMGNSSYINYIEGKNIFKYSGGHMDVYYDKIYSIDNGEFVLHYSGDYGASDNSNIQFDSDGNLIYNYYWNDVKVSKEEYNNLINETYNSQSGININELKGSNYNDFLNIIENYSNNKYESDKQSNNANKNNKGTVKIEDGYLNVRETPSTKGKIIAKLYNGDKITIEETSEDGKWYKISKGDIKGYVSKNYVKTN